MAKIIDGVSDNAKGGTEIMADRLFSSLPSDLVSKFQIWFSRYRPEQVDQSKRQIYYAHDLPGDPESEFLRNGGWNLFDKLVFVSNWQMQQYCQYYNIPYHKCIVILNAIEPIEDVQKGQDNIIRLGYWSTPHRGLAIVVPVFEYLASIYNDIELDVFSSFQLYGWQERDAPYQQLFDRCRAHPKINYHGTVDNETIRQYAARADILAYPSVWPETSCIVLMEAMSAGMTCVHSNLAALYETGANWTTMYQFHEDLNEHAKTFHLHLEKAITDIRKHRGYGRDVLSSKLQAQQDYANLFYNWDIRKTEWISLLEQIDQSSEYDSIILQSSN